MLLFLYNLLLLPALGLAFPIYLRRMLRRGGYRRNFVQRFGFFSKRLRARFLGHRWIWIRAVSVGEMVTALRLVEALYRQDPGLNFLLSTTTSTGYQLGLAQANAATTVVVYNPIDFWPVIAWVWRRIQPERIVLIDSDLWPSFLVIAHRQRTPVYLANARLSPRSERRYRRTAWLAKRFFWQRLTQVLAQDEGDVPRWQSVGVPPERIIVTGSIKFDLAETNSTAGKRFFDLLHSVGINTERPIILGGSLHPGEEALLLDALPTIRAEFPSTFLILVPRHVERRPEIEKEIQARGLRYTLRSQLDLVPDPEILLLDSTGELKDWYPLASVVVIGKSFTGTGGQNPVEALLAHKPVICGPHMENFAFLVNELVHAQALLQLGSAIDLPRAILQILRDPGATQRMITAADQVLAFHRGATARTAEIVLEGR